MSTSGILLKPQLNHNSIRLVICSCNKTQVGSAQLWYDFGYKSSLLPHLTPSWILPTDQQLQFYSPMLYFVPTPIVPLIIKVSAVSPHPGICVQCPRLSKIIWTLLQCPHPSMNIWKHFDVQCPHPIIIKIACTGKNEAKHGSTEIVYIKEKALDGSTEIKYICKSMTKYLMSLMDQNTNHIYWRTHRQKRSKTFYVHDGSTEIVYKQKRSKTVYVHDGSTEFIYIGKSITKYLMSMMDQRKSYILTNTQKKNKAKHFMSMMDQRKLYM